VTSPIPDSPIEAVAVAVAVPGDAAMLGAAVAEVNSGRKPKNNTCPGSRAMATVSQAVASIASFVSLSRSHKRGQLLFDSTEYNTLLFLFFLEESS